MYKKFLSLPKILQVLLLLIPFVNFITELVIRIDLYEQDNNTGNLVLLILGIITAGLIGFIDAVIIIVKGEVLRLDK